MSRDASGIVGKTITGIIHKKSADTRRHPREQVFLLFSDNTYYEFYCYDSEIRQTKGLCQGSIKEVREYMNDSMKIVFEKQISNT